jgi:hypothetical protein
MNTPSLFSFFGEKRREVKRKVKAEEVVLNLIRHENERNGMVYEPKIVKMATLLNIHPDRYERIRERLIERGKIAKNGMKLSLL